MEKHDIVQYNHTTAVPETPRCHSRINLGVEESSLGSWTQDKRAELIQLTPEVASEHQEKKKKTFTFFKFT